MKAVAVGRGGNRQSRRPPPVRGVLLAAGALLALAAPAAGQNAPAPPPPPVAAPDEDGRIRALEQKLEAVLQELAELKGKEGRIQQLEAEVATLKATPPVALQPGADGAAWSESFPGRADEFRRSEMPPGFGGLYTKPFLRDLGRKTYVGGYYDFEFREVSRAEKGFDQHRLIPFIYSDISDSIKFATEIEIEHGGPDNNQGDGEIKVEFATLDFLLSDAVNIRSGIILSPLGRFNLIHDSPINDLVDRPLVDRFVIPTTLSETGIGSWGKLYEGESSRWDYELYLVNGFQGLVDPADGPTVNISRGSGLRDARGSNEFDFNNSPSAVGRLQWSPKLGLELGASFHTGTYDDSSSNRLDIVALDAHYLILPGESALTSWMDGPLELQGEYAYANIGRNDFAVASGVPNDLKGGYFQAGYHFMPQCLQDWLPKVFSADSTFTLTYRYDNVDLDGNNRNRHTLGLNFRPIEETVIKLDFFHEDRDEDFGGNDGDQGILFGFATYF